MPNVINEKIEKLKAKNGSNPPDEADLKEIQRLQDLKLDLERCNKFALYAACLLGDDKSPAAMIGDVEKLRKHFLEDRYRSSPIDFDNAATKQEMEALRDVVLLRAKDRPEFVDLSSKLGRAVTQDTPVWNLFQAACQTEPSEAAKRLCDAFGIKSCEDGVKRIFAVADAKIQHIKAAREVWNNHINPDSGTVFEADEKRLLESAVRYAQELGLPPPFDRKGHNDNTLELLGLSPDQIKRFCGTPKPTLTSTTTPPTISTSSSLTPTSVATPPAPPPSSILPPALLRRQTIGLDENQLEVLKKAQMILGDLNNLSAHDIEKIKILKDAVRLVFEYNLDPPFTFKELLRRPEIIEAVVGKENAEWVCDAKVDWYKKGGEVRNNWRRLPRNEHNLNVFRTKYVLVKLFDLDRGGIQLPFGLPELNALAREIEDSRASSSST